MTLLKLHLSTVEMLLLCDDSLDLSPFYKWLDHFLTDKFFVNQFRFKESFSLSIFEGNSLEIELATYSRCQIKLLKPIRNILM